MSEEGELFIRLYLDEDVHKRVAAALRLRNFDVVSIHELNRQGLTDEEQLALAVREKRTIFSFNTTDFLELRLDWMQQNRLHNGIIVSDQQPLSEVIKRLLTLLNRVTADEIAGQIFWLQAFK